MVLLSISLCLKHAYSLSPMQNQMGLLPVHTGSDPRCGWFGFGTETNMHDCVVHWCTGTEQGNHKNWPWYHLCRSLTLMRTHHAVDVKLIAVCMLESAVHDS